MQFILTGFTQETGFRVFAFEGVVVGQIRTVFTVRADLALSRRYGIAMQELPLLCRSLLDRQEEDGHNTDESGEHDSLAKHALTFSEEEMRVGEERRFVGATHRLEWPLWSFTVNATSFPSRETEYPSME